MKNEQEKFNEVFDEPLTAKPKIKLVGEDGNAFAIMGRCGKAAKRAGWSKKEIKAVITEMAQGDYDHLLNTVAKYFDVE